MPKISVIVPIYNTEKYLERSVGSVLNQTFTDFELILVDDGSTDGSGAICDEYAAHDERVRVIHKSNGGLKRAIVTGVNAAACEFTAFCDSDDEMRTDSLAFFYNEMVSKNLDGVRTVCVGHDLDGSIQISDVVPTRVYNKDEIFSEILRPYFEENSDFTLTWSNSRCGKLYKTALLKELIPSPNMQLVMGEDLALNLEYLFLCNRVEVVSDYHSYDIFERSDSLQKGFSEAAFERYKLLHQELKRIAQNNGLQGSSLQQRFENVQCSLIFNWLFGRYEISKKIAQVKKIYSSLENKEIIRTRAESVYYLFRPGVKLIADGHITLGVIIAGLSNTAVTFAAKLFKKQIEQKNAANNGKQP